MSDTEAEENPEGPPPGVFSLEELDQLVTWTLVRTARRVERMLADLFATHGLTPVQFGVLVHLAADNQMTQSQLARAVMVRPQSINTVIAEMIERGLLKRDGPGGRGRPTPISLTDAGLELLQSIQPSVLRANEPALLGLDSRRANRLNEILLKVLESDLATDFDSKLRSPGTSTQSTDPHP